MHATHTLLSQPGTNESSVRADSGKVNNCLPASIMARVAPSQPFAVATVCPKGNNWVDSVIVMRLQRGCSYQRFQKTEPNS